MKKTSRALSKLTGILVMALVAVLSIGAAVAVQTYLFPQKAYVNGVTFTLNGQPWTNGTGFDWGFINPGAATNASLNVNNVGNANYTLALIPPVLPDANWTETWNLTGTTIHSTETLNGTVSLFVPAYWPAGNVTLLPFEVAVNQVP